MSLDLIGIGCSVLGLVISVIGAGLNSSRRWIVFWCLMSSLNGFGIALNLLAWGRR